MGFIERSGQRFGKLVAIDGLMEEVPGGGKQMGWICLCDCGKYTWVRANLLERTNSCGCSRVPHMIKIGILGRKKLQENRKKKGFLIGHSHTKLYSRWKEMKSRCSNPKYKKWYADVKICDEWKYFHNFKKDMEESFLEHYEKYGSYQTTLDRINPFGGYSKENCRWATRYVQTHNRRNNF